MKRPLKHWLVAAAVFCALIGLTFWMWQQQLQHQRTLLSKRTEDVCVQAARRLEVFMTSHLRVASIFARRWSTHETRNFSKTRFQEFASVLISELPGYYAIALIPRDLGSGWVYPAHVPLDRIVLAPERRDMLTSTSKHRKPVLSKPFRSVQGALTVFAVLPLIREDEFLGYLVVDFRARSLIDDCFHESIRSKYHFIIQDGDQVIFRSAQEATQGEFARASPISRISVSVINRTWLLSMIPRKEKAHAFGWSANLALPVFGLLMSLGLSFLVFMLLNRMQMYRIACDQQKALSRKVLMAQEEERARVSRELHDELGQILTALRLELGWLEKKWKQTLANEKGVLDSVIAMITQATEELRRLCRGLRPPVLDDLGLEPAVRLLVEEFQTRSAIKIHLDLEEDEYKHSLAPEVALSTYRILQEALNNASRHSQANNIFIQLRTSHSEIDLHIRDDGIGFDIGGVDMNGGCGLEGMKERACLVGGSIEVESSKGRGTRVKLTIPFRYNQKREEIL